MEANNGLFNGKGRVNDENNIGKCSNGIIDMTAVFSAVEVRRELADFANFQWKTMRFGGPRWPKRKKRTLRDGESTPPTPVTG